MYELQEPSVKLNSRENVRCVPVVDSDNNTLSNVLVPHPAALMALTAADVFDARNDARTARDCEALLGLLEGMTREQLPEHVREWRKVIHDIYEGLQYGKRESAYHAIERAVSALVRRTDNQAYLALIPELSLNDLSTM
jgi:hypothetical protein